MPRKTKAQRELDRLRAAWQDAEMRFNGPWQARRDNPISYAEREAAKNAWQEAEIAEPTDSATWEAMRAQAVVLGWPERYRWDLCVDKAWITADWSNITTCGGTPPTDPAASWDGVSPFGWGIGPSGCHIARYTGNHPPANAAHPAKLWPECHWFMWSPRNQSLTPATPEEIDRAIGAYGARVEMDERRARERADEQYRKFWRGQAAGATR